MRVMSGLSLSNATNVRGQIIARIAAHETTHIECVRQHNSQIPPNHSHLRIELFALFRFSV